jgi:hypothetical protein
LATNGISSNSTVPVQPESPPSAGRGSRPYPPRLTGSSPINCQPIAPLASAYRRFSGSAGHAAKGLRNSSKERACGALKNPTSGRAWSQIAESESASGMSGRTGVRIGPRGETSTSSTAFGAPFTGMTSFTTSHAANEPSGCRTERPS